MEQKTLGGGRRWAPAKGDRVVPVLARGVGPYARHRLRQLRPGAPTAGTEGVSRRPASPKDEDTVSLAPRTCWNNVLNDGKSSKKK